MNVVIYHNPKCSKSRQTLALLEERGISPEIRKYIKSPLNKSELLDLSKKLELPFSSMVRTKESEIKENNIDINRDEECLEAMIKFPKLLERPIVVVGNKAVFGRPPENILSII